MLHYKILFPLFQYALYFHEYAQIYELLYYFYLYNLLSVSSPHAHILHSLLLPCPIFNKGEGEL